jgi:hypothetical protein
MSESAKHVPRMPRIWVVCEVCQARFSMSPSEYKQRMERSKNGVIYCSKGCVAVSLRLRRNMAIELMDEKLETAL